MAARRQAGKLHEGGDTRCFRANGHDWSVIQSQVIRSDRVIMDDSKRWDFGGQPLAMPFPIPTAAQKCRRPESNCPSNLKTEGMQVSYIVGREYFRNRNSISERP